MNNRQAEMEVVVTDLVEKLVEGIEMDTRDEIRVALDTAYETLDAIMAGHLEFSYQGIKDAGFWGKAWWLNQRYGEALEDMYQEIVLAAIEMVQTKPEVLTQGPGYLLQVATWRAQNAVRKYRSTYLAQMHSITLTSLDVEDKTGSTKAERVETPMVDLEMKVAIKQVVTKLDPKDAEIARYLMDGYTKAEVARLVGVTKAAITYRLRNLKKAMETEQVAEVEDPGTPEPQTPVALRKVWWAN